MAVEGIGLTTDETGMVAAVAVGIAADMTIREREDTKEENPEETLDADAISKSKYPTLIEGFLFFNNFAKLPDIIFFGSR